MHSRIGEIDKLPDAQQRNRSGSIFTIAVAIQCLKDNLFQLHGNLLHRPLRGARLRNDGAFRERIHNSA